MEFPTPTSVTKIFMRLAGYYQHFIVGFSGLAHPITSLQKKGKKYERTQKCDRDFQELKRALMSAPILAVLDPSTNFVVCTGASLDGIGEILM